MNRYLTNSIYALIVVSGTALESCTQGKGNIYKPVNLADPVPVRVASVRQSISKDTIHVSGSFTTDDETVLSFKMGGIIDQVLVNEGDRVRKGQLLARLRQDEISASVSQADEQFAKAKRDYERMAKLYADSVATLEQLENSRTGFRLAAEQLKAANFNKKYTFVYAPDDGYVVRKMKQPGELISPGAPVLVTNSALASGWLLKAAITDKQWSQISGRERALISADAFQGKTFEGTVIRKSKTVDPLTGLFSIDIKINLNGTQMGNGIFGKAIIIPHTSDSVWSVPYEAVLDASGGAGFVFITRDNQTAIKVPVEIGAFRSNRIELTGGLSNGDKLIVSGSAYLSDDAVITIQNK